MRWLLDNSDAVKNLAARDPNGDELCFSTIDTWLIAVSFTSLFIDYLSTSLVVFLMQKLSGLNSVVTDSTNASRTMLMDINSLEWSQPNLDLFGVNKGWLPRIVKNSSDDFGRVDAGQCA